MPMPFTMSGELGFSLLPFTGMRLPNRDRIRATLSMVFAQSTWLPLCSGMPGKGSSAPPPREALWQPQKASAAFSGFSPSGPSGSQVVSVLTFSNVRPIMPAQTSMWMRQDTMPTAFSANTVWEDCWNLNLTLAGVPWTSPVYLFSCMPWGNSGSTVNRSAWPTSSFGTTLKCPGLEVWLCRGRWVRGVRGLFRGGNWGTPTAACSEACEPL
mmetsp:Transcript_47084/g.131040  ORF Transcript_47084/g.131040 Transcript_47084/m.131040 type:complete len:212 (-) Transcript_47084:660-1295(-)